LLLELRSSSLAEADAVVIGVIGVQGRLARERLSRSGSGLPGGVKFPETVVVNLEDGAGRVKVIAEAIAGQDDRRLALGYTPAWVPVPAGRQSKVVIELSSGPVDDVDNDGIPRPIDNCPSFPNPDQEDVDRNGIGDLCEGIDASVDGPDAGPEGDDGGSDADVRGDGGAMEAMPGERNADAVDGGDTLDRTPDPGLEAPPEPPVDPPVDPPSDPPVDPAVDPGIDASLCNEVDNTGCGSGMKCGLFCPAAGVSCGPVGSRTGGQSCGTGVGDCIGGYACGRDSMGVSKCYKHCRTSGDCPAPEMCRGVLTCPGDPMGSPPKARVCLPPPSPDAGPD